MAGQKNLWWLLAVCCLYCMGGLAAEQQSVAEADIEFLEFLGSMEDGANEWEEFIEIASNGIPPLVAEVEHED